MPRVYFTTTAASSVEITDEDIAAAAEKQGIDIDDVDIVDLAYEKFTYPRICAQCSGWGSDWELDMSGEWEADEDVEF